VNGIPGLTEGGASFTFLRMAAFHIRFALETVETTIRKGNNSTGSVTVFRCPAMFLVPLLPHSPPISVESGGGTIIRTATDSTVGVLPGVEDKGSTWTTRIETKDFTTNVRL
jgi:hypothetical protein